LGADDIIDPSSIDLSEKVSELVGTCPMICAPNLTSTVLEVAFECTGALPVVEQLFYIAREGAKIVLVASYEDNINLNLNMIMGKGLRVLGSYAYSGNELAESLEMIRSGKVNRRPLISHEFSLDDAKEAFETQLITDKSIKVIVKP
jgi:threonine dehydrogenase-like Zn-dependent dehydrogenase